MSPRLRTQRLAKEKVAPVPEKNLILTQVQPLAPERRRWARRCGTLLLVDELTIAQDAWDKVVAMLGKPGHCKYVDSAMQSAVKSALKSQGAQVPPGLAKHLGAEAEKFCKTKITPEGRTLAVIAAGTAATIYTVMNYEEVEDAILEAARKAKVSLKVPIPSEYGKLTAKVGFDSARAQYELRQPNGTRLKAFFEQDYNGDNQRYGIGASRSFGNNNGSGNWNFNAGVNAEGKASVMFKLEITF